jgi:hypothetical protein
MNEARSSLFLRLIMLAALCGVLSSCILTLGAPLTKKIVPDAWTIDAGGGISVFSDAAGPAAFAYAAKAFGPYLELGLLPYYFTMEDLSCFAVNIPLLWDPFPHEWPFHLLVYGGPTLYMGDISGGALTLGLGLSWTIVDWLELYATVSDPVPFVQFATGSAGMRLHFGGFQVGAGVTYTILGPATGMLEAGYSFGGQ